MAKGFTDSLQIKIEADAQKASQALNTLIADVTKLSSALAGTDFTKVNQGLKDMARVSKQVNLKNISNSMAKLASSTKKYNAVMSQVKKSTQSSRASLHSFTTGVNGIQGALSRVNTRFNEFVHRIRSANKETKNFAQTIGLLYARFWLLIRGAKTLMKSVKSSMDYIEVLNYFNASFGQVASKAVDQWSEMGYESAQAYYDSFAERAKKVTADMSGFFPEQDGSLTPMKSTSLGMNPQDLMKFQSMYAQMASSMGTTSEQAVLLSEVLTKLGADLASVKNMDFDEVWTNMASGLVGMSRTLDKFGVNIRASNMQMKLSELGIQANVNQLTQADKALLRTIILLEGTKYAWADLADTLDTPANQLRMLTNNVRLLGQMIGNILLPVVAKILPYLNAFVIVLQRLFMWLAKILGIDLSGLQAKNTGLDNSGISDMLDDAEDLSDALDDDTDSAKKLKKQLQGFDALNNLTSNEDKGKDKFDMGGIGGLLNDAFLDAVNDYLKAWQDAFDKLENKAQALADKIERAFINLVDPVVRAWEEWGDFVVSGWKTALKKFKNLLSSVWKDFDEVWHQDKTVEIFENIFEIVGKIGFAFGELADRAREAWEANENGKKILEGIRDIILNITDHYANMATATLEWAENLNLEPLFSSIQRYVESLKPVIDALYGVLEDFYENVLLKLSKWALEEGLPDLLQVFIDFNKNVNWHGLRTRLNELWETLERFGETVGEGIIIFIDRLTDGIANFLNGKIDKFIDFFEWFINLFTAEDIANLIEGFIKTIIGLKLTLAGFTLAKGLANTVETLGKLKPLAKVIKNIGASFKILGANIKDTVYVIAYIFKNVGAKAGISAIFSTISQGIVGIRQSLTPATKALMGFGAVFLELKVIPQAVNDLFNGVGSQAGNIIKIIGSITVACGALGLSFGWTGVAIGAILGVVTALVSLQDAMVDSIDVKFGERLEEIFTSNGTPLREVVDNFTDGIREIGNGFDSIRSSAGALDQAQADVKGVADAIDLIRTNMKEGVISVEEGVEEISQHFDRLLEITQDKFNAMSSAMNGAFGENGALHDAFEQMGKDSTQIISTTTKLSTDTIARMEELKEAMANIDVNSDEWQALYDEYLSLAGGVDAVTNATQNLETQIDALKDADWSEYFSENADTANMFKQTIGDIAQAIEGTQSSIKETGDILDDYFNEYVYQAVAQGNEKVANELKTYKKDTTQVLDQMSDDVALKGKEFTDEMQRVLISKVPEIISEAEEQFENLDLGEKIALSFDGIHSKEDYAKHQVEEYINNTVNPISDEIENSFKELGVNGAGWAREAMEQIFEEGFNSVATNSFGSHMGGHSTISTTISDNLSSIINDAIESASGTALTEGERIGESIVSGTTSGVSSHTSDFTAVNEALANSGVNAMKTALESHSPSQVYFRIGEDITQGLINGVESKSGLFDSALKRLVNGAVKAFNSQTSTFATIGSNLMNGLLSGISRASSQVSSVCSSIAGRVTSSFRSVWKIHSPSRVMDEMGVNLMLGLKNGIEDMYEPIERSISTFEAEITQAPKIEATFTPDNIAKAESARSSDLMYNANVDNSDTNSLLREQNTILMRILEKEWGITDGAIFKSVQQSARAYQNRTGDYAFN